MATGETGFNDVTFDLVTGQYHSLKAGHDLLASLGGTDKTSSQS